MDNKEVQFNLPEESASAKQARLRTLLEDDEFIDEVWEKIQSRQKSKIYFKKPVSQAVLEHTKTVLGCLAGNISYADPLKTVSMVADENAEEVEDDENYIDEDDLKDDINAEN